MFLSFTSTMNISIVIPAYNEEAAIASTIKEIIEYHTESKDEFELIVVDDGSTDNTRKKVKEITENHPQVKLTPLRINRGKGYSVREGMLLASKEWVLFLDADNSTSITELDTFRQHMDNQDILIGSRNLKDSKILIPQPLVRSMLGKAFPFLVKLFLIKDIADTQCGFKLFSKKHTLDLFGKQHCFGWGFDVEILYLAQRKNLAIKELPITWKNNRDSKVSALLAPVHMFFDLFRIRWNDFRGHYSNED